MRRIALLLLPLLLVLPATLVEADCAIARLELGAAIATGTRLPIGAPILAVPGNAWGVAGGPVTRELVGARHIALTARTIAPDVTALVPATPPTPGVYQVTGLREALTVEYTADPLPAVLAAPQLRAVAYGSLGFDRHAGERFAATATLGGVPPSGAVLVLARWWVGGRPAGTSFAAVTPGTSSQAIYASAEGCGALSASVLAPPPGASADIAWVDLVGHVSPWSSRVVVTR
jgi:hypothetical protein